MQAVEKEFLKQECDNNYSTGQFVFSVGTDCVDLIDFTDSEIQVNIVPETQETGMLAKPEIKSKHCQTQDIERKDVEEQTDDSLTKFQALA